MLEYFLIGIITFLFLWFLNDQFGTVGKKLPPGPVRLPFFGNLLELAYKSKNVETYQLLKQYSNKYGPIMTLKSGFQLQVVIDDYDLIRENLCDENFSSRPVNSWVLERSWGRELGILWGNGEPWKELRRFTLRTLRDFGFGKQKSQDEIMEDELKDIMTNTLNTQLNQPILLSKIFTVSILNILWSMMAGIRFSHNDPKLTELVQMMTKMMRLLNFSGSIFIAYPFLRHVLPRLTNYGAERKKFIPVMQERFRKILEDRRQLGYFREEQRDYIDVFLWEIEKQNKGNGTKSEVFNDEQFIIATMDLFVAGSETTSNTLEFGILYMILNPSVQSKVQSEIDSVIGTSRFPKSTDKPNMPYTEATILEIQRMASVVPVTGRQPTNSDAVIDGYVIPKGAYTIFNLYGLHHDTGIWGDPENFRPERFLTEDHSKINVSLSEKVLPFGLGRRLCPGEILARSTLFIYLTTLLQNYTFLKSEAHSEPNVVPRAGLTLSPSPFWVVVKNRK